jgi:hypothetical protein
VTGEQGPSKNVAELLREIAARDPEAHKRALGRAYDGSIARSAAESVPVTSEAQGISEQVDLRLWRDEIGRLTAALADRDRELAELRAKIAEVRAAFGWRLRPDAPGLPIWQQRAVAALASSGSAPTGQEER